VRRFPAVQQFEICSLRISPLGPWGMQLVLAYRYFQAFSHKQIKRVISPEVIECLRYAKGKIFFRISLEGVAFDFFLPFLK
jgi:hypothetical protein